MTSQCYFVKLVALFSNKVLYGYNCNLEELYANIREANRFYIIEQNIESCKLYGDIIDDLNKFKRKLNDTFTTYCRECEESTDTTTNCSDITLSISNSYNSVTTYFTFVATSTNTNLPVTYRWFYDPTYWTVITNNKNKLVLQPIVTSGVYVYTNIGVSLVDNKECLKTSSIPVSYHAGCLDPLATNYDITAILDNNICTYPEEPL